MKKILSIINPLTLITAFIIIVIIPLSDNSIISQYPPRSLFLGFIGALFFLISLFINKKKTQITSISGMDILMILFYLFHLISFASMDFKESGVTPLIIESGFILLYFFFRHFLSEGHDFAIETIKALFTLSCAIISLWALAQFFFNWDVTAELSNLFKTHHFPVIASLNNPNFLAEYLVLCLPITISFFFKKKNNLWGASIILQSTAVFATYSRLGWLMLFIVLISALFTVPLKKRKSFLIILSTTLVILSSIFIYHYAENSTRAQRIITGAQNPTKVITQERSLIYKTSLNILNDTPFLGFGPGTFSRLYLPYQAKTRNNEITNGPSINLDHVHNDFLQKAIEAGPLSAVTLILMLLFSSLTFIQIYKKKKDDSILYIIPLILIPFCFWSFPMHLPGSRIIFSFAIALSAHRQTKIYFNVKIPFSFLIKVILLSLFIFISSMIILSDIYHTKGIYEKDHFKSTLYFRKGLRFYPYNGFSIFALGTQELNSGNEAGILKLERSLKYFSNTRTYLYIARAYDEMEDIYNAEIWYKKALNMQPKNNVIKEEAKRFFRRNEIDVKQDKNLER